MLRADLIKAIEKRVGRPVNHIEASGCEYGDWLHFRTVDDLPLFSIYIRRVTMSSDSWICNCIQSQDLYWDLSRLK